MSVVITLIITLKQKVIQFYIYSFTLQFKNIYMDFRCDALSQEAYAVDHSAGLLFFLLKSFI